MVRWKTVEGQVQRGSVASYWGRIVGKLLSCMDAIQILEEAEIFGSKNRVWYEGRSLTHTVILSLHVGKMLSHCKEKN